MSKSILITSNLYRPHIGGVENSLFHLAQSYLQLGYKPIIVTSDISPRGEALPEHEQQNGIEIYRYSMSAKKKLFGLPLPKLIANLYSAVEVYKNVNKLHSPCLTITRYHFNQVAAKLAGIQNTLYLVPGVVKFQNSNKNITKNGVSSVLQHYYHRLLQYFALKHCDQVGVFSMNMVKQVNAITKQLDFPMVTKPGVDENRFYPLNQAQKLAYRKQLELDFDGKVFLCVGRFVKAKGFDLVIKALKLVKAEDYQLWLIGDGPMKAELMQLAKESGVEEKVKFLGTQSEPERFYRAADYFVMSSIYEPLGQTILEGLSSGLPIVTFDRHSGVETATHELLNHNHGYFVSRIECQELASQLDNLITLPNKDYVQKSGACTKLAKQRYRWEKLALDLLGKQKQDATAVEAAE